MLVTVIQNRNPNFRSFISPRNLLINKNTAVVRNSDQTALLQSIQKRLSLLYGLLICLDLRICLGKLTLKFERKVGEAGVLYGSVTSMDIAHELKEQGYEIDRRKIVLREPIKRFGSYNIPVRLHREVTVELPISVLGEGGVEVNVEAMQAEGESAPASAETEANEADRDR